MVDPAMPSRTDGQGLSQTFVDHPAPLEAERRIDSTSLRPVVAIAVFVFAHELAVARGPHQRIEGRAIPPRKKAEQEFLHSHESNAPCCSCRMARCRRSRVDATGADLCP